MTARCAKCKAELYCPKCTPSIVQYAASMGRTGKVLVAGEKARALLADFVNSWYAAGDDPDIYEVGVVADSAREYFEEFPMEGGDEG